MFSLIERDMKAFIQGRQRKSDLPPLPSSSDLLRQVLNVANEFVPSESGAILLDHPLEKRESEEPGELTFAVAFGPSAYKVIGATIPIDSGIAGEVYRTGRPYCTNHAPTEEHFNKDVDRSTGYSTESILAVPIVLEKSVCGVIELLNRKSSEGFTESEQGLLQIFAGYISTTMLNALDATRIRELAVCDNLTGLHNDMSFQSLLMDTVKSTELDDTTFSLIFLDLDNFKSINDTRGHLAGSQTLTEVGHLIAEIPNTQAARYGGDEFVILCPNTTAQEACELAEDLRKQIHAHHYLKEREEQHQGIVSASIGLTEYNHDSYEGTYHDRLRELIHQADSAMYDAKAAGKNTVCVRLPSDAAST